MKGSYVGLITVQSAITVPELPGKKALRAEWENLAEGYACLAQRRANNLIPSMNPIVGLR